MNEFKKTNKERRFHVTTKQLEYLENLKKQLGLKFMTLQ